MWPLKSMCGVYRKNLATQGYLAQWIKESTWRWETKTLIGNKVSTFINSLLVGARVKALTFQLNVL